MKGRKIFVSMLALGALLSMPVPLQAAEGYDYAEILTTVKNPEAPGEFPIRRGYFDGTKGFGYDKAYHKHGLTDLEAIKKVAVSPESEWQGNSLVAKAYVGKYTCNLLACNLEDQREVRVVFTTDTQHLDKTFDSQVGMITAYCQNPDGAPKCPDWVQPSILRPGTPVAGASMEETRTNVEGQEISMTTFSYEPLETTRER